MSIDIAKWQGRLESTFGQRGDAGPLGKDVWPKEQEYGHYVIANAYGYVVLANSFQSFFYETITTCLTQYRHPNATKEAPYQPTVLLEHLTLFRSIRATENLLYCGYPLDAYSLLRDVRDRAIFLAAIISGITSYQALNATHLLPPDGVEPDDDLADAMRKVREQEERRVMALMMGEASGLPEATQRLLRRWRRVFNLEVHGSRLTTAGEFTDWLRKKEPLSIGPVPREGPVTVYINTAPPVFWMVHRTLPFLQLKRGAFGTAWSQKWRILDDAFRTYQLGFEASGKPSGPAVRELVETKFPFSVDTIYVERNTPQ